MKKIKQKHSAIHPFSHSVQSAAIPFETGFRKLLVKPSVFLVRFRSFANNYKLPLIMTLFFCIIVLAIAGIRFFEKTSLVSLLPQVTRGGDDYATLLIGDEADRFEKGDTSFTPPSTSDDAQAPAGTSTSFTLNADNPPSNSNTGSGTTNNEGGNQSNNGGSSGGNGGSGGDNSTPTPPPFASSIAYFQHSDTVLECPGIRLVKGQCSAVYTFSAGVSTTNGPGNVQYSWVSNIQDGNANGSYNAPAGSATTPLQQKITLRCNQTQSFSMQFIIHAPTTTQSSPKTINHNCDNL